MKKAKSIFVVTSMYVGKKPSGRISDTIRNSRVFGFFFQYRDAVNAVKENRCDIHECLYNYVVIEETPEGIHPYGCLETWFKWDRKTAGFKPILRKPPCLKGIVNFGIG